jgi:hypothetical protein
VARVLARVASGHGRQYHRLVSARDRVWTGLVALALGLAGFLGGGLVAGWVERDNRAAPWRKLRVDHEGTKGTTTRTRAIFDSPKVALQGVEVTRSPEGRPEAGNVEVRGGGELAVRYDVDGRPSRLEADDGSAATVTYKGSKARVAFETPDGTAAGEAVITVPVVVRSALELAMADWSLVGNAYAQAGGAEPPKKITVRREVTIPVQIRLGPGGKPGEARVEASCAPYTCVPLTPTLSTPASSRVRIQVSAQQTRGAAAADATALAPFKDLAVSEAGTAEKVLVDVAKTIGAVGVVAEACEKLKRTGALCVPQFRRAAVVGGAVHAVQAHEVPRAGPLLDSRATTLFHEEQARATLDRALNIEVCFARGGYTRICTKLPGRPFGPTAMAVAGGAFEMRRGISGSVEGGHVMTQADGPDCKFSPAPKTDGPFTLTFDSKTGKVGARFSANGKGTRPGLACSLGSGDMRWTQNYSGSLSQAMSPSQLQAGGTIALDLRGTMNGSGSTSQSNCRSKGGASASCPGGRNESYSYPVHLTGNFNLDDETGSGQLNVSGSPLSTSGTWRVPKR